MRIFLLFLAVISLVFALAWYEYTIRKLCDGGDRLSCAEIAGGR